MNAVKQISCFLRNPARTHCARIVSRFNFRETNAPIGIWKFHTSCGLLGDIQEINMRPQVYVTRPDYAEVGMELLREE